MGDSWLPISHLPGTSRRSSMPADSLSSDDFLQSDSEDGSEDGFVELRVGSKASKASRKECGNGNDSSDSSGDFSDDCTQGPCASSSNGRLPDNRKRKNRKTERRQGALDQWQIVEGYAQVTEERINAMLAKTAKSELGGSARWGPDIRVLLVCGGELAFPRQKVALRRGS